MTLIQLQYVLSVAEHKNFTLAADNSYVTQPTLSMQIQKLERELEVEIFDRKTHPITITKIGEKIITQAKAILREASKLQQLVDEERGMMSGKFSIGIIPTVLPSLVPLFLKTFNKNNPEVSLRIMEMKTKDILSALKNGTLDYGISVTPLEDSEIVEVPLYYEPMVAYVTGNHDLFEKKVLKETDLISQDVILMEEGHCFRNNVLSICESTNLQERSVQIESGSFNALIKLVKDGFGMTLLPSLQIDDLPDVEKNYIRRFEEPEPTRQVSLVYHKSQLRLSFANELSKLIRGILRGKIFLESDNVTSPLLKVAK